MTADPTCEVKDGAAAYVTTANGVNVTPGNTIVIRLADQSDVQSWLIECATTDDTSDAGAVTASLQLDTVAKTATFTAPGTGKAYRFRSRVNGGIDVNGTAQPSYTTTFCIYTLTGGRRVVAADETTEGDATFGWIKWINDVIRNPTSGGNTQPAGGANQVQFYNGGSFGGASGLLYDPTTRQITVATGGFHSAPRMLGAVLGGTTVYTGTSVAAVGDTYHKPYSTIANVETSSATPQTLFAWRIRDEGITSVFVECNAVPSGGAAGGSYGRRARIWANGGVATMGSLENVWNDEVTALGFTGISVGSGITIGHSGMTGFVNVRGTATGRIRFGATISRAETGWA